ncbi:MAG: glycosyltransferase [Phycisphaeraceae bacterium]
MPPTLSLFITSYNQCDYLREAIDSVLAQTRRPDQIVIIDDASSDNSQQLIQAYASEHPGLIDYALHDNNQGVSATKSHAASLCTSDLMTYLDGDDRMLPTRLETELQLLRALPVQTIVFSDFRTIDSDGHIIADWAEGTALPQGNTLDKLLARDYPKGIVYRNELMPRDLFKQVGGYDQKLNLYEDWDLRIRMATAGATSHFCAHLGSEYRLHPAGISRQNPERHLDAVNHIRRKHQSTIDSLQTSQRIAANLCFDRLEQAFAKRAAQRSFRQLRFKDALRFSLRAWSRQAA